jgi:hypothetical protein
MTAYDFLQAHWDDLLSLPWIVLIILLLISFKLGVIQYILTGIKFLAKIGECLFHKFLKCLTDRKESKNKKLYFKDETKEPNEIRSTKSPGLFGGVFRYKLFVKNFTIVNNLPNVTQSGALKLIKYPDKESATEYYIFKEPTDETTIRLIDGKLYIVKEINISEDFKDCGY